MESDEDALAVCREPKAVLLQLERHGSEGGQGELVDGAHCGD